MLGDVQLLHQPQYRAVLRLEPVQLFEGIACLRVVAAIDQQLRTGQADQQLGIRLALASPVQQVVGLVVALEFVGGPRRAEVMHQRPLAHLRSPPQMTQRLRPVAFAEIAQAAVLGHLHATPAVVARPGVDHPPRAAEQAQDQAHQHHQQPDHRQQGEERPQAGFVTEALVGDQHIAGLLGDRQPNQRGDQHHRQDQEVDASHGRPSVAGAACASGTRLPAASRRDT